MDMSAVRGEKGAAYAVYQHRSEEREKKDFGCIKEALYTAFALTYSNHINDLWHDNFTLENLS